MGGRGFGVRLSLVYVALFFVIGIHLPFFPVWLKYKGLSDDQIAITLSAMIAIKIFSGPLFAFIADRTGRSRHVLQALCLAVAMTMSALAFSQGFAAVLLLCILDTMVWAPVVPMIEGYAVREASVRGVSYGRLRLWGSLSFIAAGFGGGLALDYIDEQAIIVALVGAHVLLFAACLYLAPERGAEEDIEISGPPGILRLGDATNLLTRRLFLIFLLAAGLAQASHAVLYGFGTLHWREIGIPGGAIGMLWGIGVAAEVVLFAFSGSALKWIGPAGLILIGALAGIVRWTGTALDPSLPLLFGLQILHALTFGATHLGAIHFINKAVPHRLHNTAQGLYAALGVSLLMAIATAAAGGLYSTYGAYAFFAAAGMSLFAAMAAWRLFVTWDGGRIIENTSGATPKEHAEPDA